MPTPHGKRRASRGSPRTSAAIPLRRLMIAAGVNAKALSTFMGHAGIQMTLDRYGHLMPGSHQEGADLLDAYLAAQRDHAEEAGAFG